MSRTRSAKGPEAYASPKVDRAGRRSPGKLLIIGVDAGSPELLRRWCSSGDLPNIERLMTSGQTRRVVNPHALEAGCVWPVFHTGLNPGRQPQYDGRRVFVPEDYSFRWLGPDETAPTVWRQLSDQGVQCLLIDPPHLPIDPRINGTMIVDWGGHVPANDHTFQLSTHPESVLHDVTRIVGGDPAGGLTCDQMAPETVAQHKRFRDLYLKRIRLKGRLAAHMLKNRPWDLALIASSDLHCTGHHLWHVNDPDHPRYSAKLERELGEPLRDCYRAFDKTVGDLLQSVGNDTTVLVFCSHGMGPACGGSGLLDRILQRLDGGSAGGSAQSALGHPQEDYENRRFFEVFANGATGGVRLNIKGREGHGTVDPSEAERLIRHLTAELYNVVNAETGEPLAAEVYASRHWYHGPHVGNLPDLLIQWKRDAPIRCVQSETIGRVIHESSDNRTGDHTPDGLCVIVGKCLHGRGERSSVATADIAPAIARYFGFELADHDGRVFPIGEKQPSA